MLNKKNQPGKKEFFELITVNSIYPETSGLRQKQGTCIELYCSFFSGKSRPNKSLSWFAMRPSFQFYWL